MTMEAVAMAIEGAKVNTLKRTTYVRVIKGSDGFI